MPDLRSVLPGDGARFTFIMADPPWEFRARSLKGVTKKGAGGQYRTMKKEEIFALPVREVASRDSLLWLWITNPHLPLGFETLAAWGFEFKTAGHWVKTTANGNLGFGTGYVLRSAGEPFLLATRGSPALAEGEPFLIGARGRPTTTRSTRSVIVGPAREHSRKPDEAYRAAEELMPTARRLDLFSREARPGWVAWGDECGKFSRSA